jgi:hypothetical protein
MNALWVRSLGPGPDALCSESASQALKLALDWAYAIASGTNIMTATVITMEDRRMFILLGVKANKHLDSCNERILALCATNNCWDVRFVSDQSTTAPIPGYARTRGRLAIKEAAKEFNVAEALRDRIVARRENY